MSLSAAAALFAIAVWSRSAPESVLGTGAGETAACASIDSKSPNPSAGLDAPRTASVGALRALATVEVTPALCTAVLMQVPCHLIGMPGAPGRARKLKLPQMFADSCREGPKKVYARLGKACLNHWENHACRRWRRNRCSSSIAACSRRCCCTWYSASRDSRTDSSTSRFCRCSA